MKEIDLKRKIMRDIGVEISEEFDRNFTRKAFFDEPWPKRMRGGTRGTLMLVSGRTRRSIKRHVSGQALTYTSDAPWFGVHNSGGKIKITAQMRKFFWAKYYESSGKLTYSVKTRQVAKNKKNEKLSDQAAFWRNMALHKGEHIKIPKRQVIGNHRQVKKIVEETATRTLTEFAQTKLLPILKK